MKDALGKELLLDQPVAYVYGYQSKSIASGTIVGFTPTMARIKPNRTMRTEHYITKVPHLIVIVESL